MTEKMTNLMNRAKVGAACTLPVLATGAMSITSFAEDGAETGTSALMETVSASLVTACTDMATAVGNAIASIIPIAIPLVGATIVVTLGLKTFKRVTASN